MRPQLRFQNVSARLKMYPRRGYARGLCGRPTSAGQHCQGDLGRVYPLPLMGTLNELDSFDLSASMSYDIVSVGDADDAGISGQLLSLGLSGVEASDLTDLSDGAVGLFVAWHERAYQRRRKGEYVILPQRSPLWEPWRVTNTGQSLGRGFLPDAMVEEIGDHNLQVHRGRGHPQVDRPPRHWKGVVGARPVLPTVIHCPRCDAPNVVPRPDAAALREAQTEIPLDEPSRGLIS
jgi:hypothetical protein